jgi:hypothetical protein
LWLTGSGKFEINISVPLILEYEDAAKRLLGEVELSEEEIDDILDYICGEANAQEVFYLWRPFLKDAEDEMVAGVVARCSTRTGKERECVDEPINYAGIGREDISIDDGRISGRASGTRQPGEV